MHCPSNSAECAASGRKTPLCEIGALRLSSEAKISARASRLMSNLDRNSLCDVLVTEQSRSLRGYYGRGDGAAEGNTMSFSTRMLNR